MKKFAVMCFFTSLAVTGAFLSSYIYEMNLPEACTTAMSNVKFAEQVNAVGEVISYGGELKINAIINEKYASDVKNGQSVIISGKGFGECKGKIINISDTARHQSNGISEETVVDIQVEFDNDYDLSDIKSGYTANLKINISDEKDIRVVPYEAVYEDDDGNEFVYIFNNGMSCKRNIVTGSETSDGIEIISGINSNDIILLSDNDNLSDGYYVKIEE